MSAAQLVFLPLGGAGEIGMNLNAYGYGPARDRRWLVVDLGVTFAGEEHLPGVDLIFPDPTFLEGERDNIEAIVLTHAHEDHFGAVIALWPRLKAPVIATPFTAGLLRAKMAENGVDLPIPIREVPLGSRLTFGPFDVEFVSVAHSIPEPNALAIRTPAGTIVHTGDWKLDPDPVLGPTTNGERLAEIGEEGVLALVCDSTNAIRDGVSPSEGDVAESLGRIIAEAPKRVAVTIFASNVARILSVARAARAADREIVAVGRSMHRMIGVARETGYLPEGIVFRSEDEFGYLPPEKAVLLCTGSQGEARAAMARVARDEHPRIAMSAGDWAIFSSRAIPGNEKAVGAVQNALVSRGIRVITDRDALVHVSGHPRKDELRQMYAWIRPKVLVPVHGEAVHMHAQADLAAAAGIPRTVTAFNGQMVGLDLTPPQIVDEVPHGRLLQDGRVFVQDHDVSLRERRKLAFAGAIFVSMAMDARGDLVGDTEVSVVGVPDAVAQGSIVDMVHDVIEQTLEGLPRARRRDADATGDTMRRAIVNTLSKVWDKRPVCEVHVATL
jgi:ribonuclease J